MRRTRGFKQTVPDAGNKIFPVDSANLSASNHNSARRAREKTRGGIFFSREVFAGKFASGFLRAQIVCSFSFFKLPLNIKYFK